MTFHTQVYANRFQGTVVNNASRWAGLFGGANQDQDSPPLWHRDVIGSACEISDFFVEFDTEPGAGTFTVTVYKNGIATDWVLTFTGSTTYQKTTTTLVCAPGDYLSIRVVPTSSPTESGFVRKGCVLTNLVADTVQAFSHMSDANGANGYILPVFGDSGSIIEEDVYSEWSDGITAGVAELSGDIIGWRVLMSLATAEQWTIPLLKNDEATPHSLILEAGASSGYIDGLSYAFEQGDILTFEPTTPSGGRGMSWVTLYRTAQGQMFSGGATWTTAATERYFTWGQTWTGSQHTTRQDAESRLPATVSIRGLTVKLRVAPGVGDTWTFTLLDDGVDTGVGVAISGTDTIGSTDDTYEAPVDARLCLRATPTGSPAEPDDLWWYFSGEDAVVDPTQYRLMLSDGTDPDIPVYNITPLNVGKSGAMLTRFERGRERAVIGEPPRAGALSTRVKNDAASLGYTGAPSAAWTLDEPSPGLAVRLNKSLDSGVTWHHMAQGNIDTIQHHFGADGFRSLIDIRANGPFAKLAGKKVTTALYQNITTGEAIEIVLNEAGFPEHLRDIATGVVTLDWWWLADADAMTSIVQLVNTEGLTADLFEAGDGKITFRDRNARYTDARSATAQSTFTSEGDEPRFTGFDYTPGFREIVNEAKATRYRLTVDPAPSSTTVWEDGDGISYIVPPNGTLVVEATTTLPVSSVITPVSGTDYTVGLGSAVATLNRVSGSRFTITYTNSDGLGATLANLQLRANTQYIQHGPIEEVSGGIASVRVDVDDSVAAYGLRSWQGSMWSYIGHADMRDNLDVITTVKKDPRAWVRIGLNAEGGTARNTATAERELGDRIRIINSNPGVEFNEFCWIERIEHEVQAPEREITYYECTPITGALGTNPYDDITNGAGVDTSDEGGSATGTGSTGSSGSSSPSPIALYGFASGNQLTTFNGVQRITGGDATNIANLIAAGADNAKILVDNGVSITLTSQLVLTSFAKLYVPHGGSASISGGSLAGAAIYLNGATDVLIGGLNITSAPGDYTSSNNPASAIEITGASDRIQIVGTTITSPTFGGAVTDAPEGVNIWNNGTTVSAGPGSVTFYRVYWPVAGAGNSTAKSKGVIAGGTTIATRNALTFYECVFSAWQRLPFVQDGAIADIVNCVYPNIDRIDAIEVADGGEARARASVFRNSTDGSHAWETRNLGGGYIAEGPEANDYQNSATFTEVSPFQVFTVPYSLTVNTAAYVHANVESNVGAGSVIIPE